VGSHYPGCYYLDMNKVLASPNIGVTDYLYILIAVSCNCYNMHKWFGHRMSLMPSFAAHV